LCLSAFALQTSWTYSFSPAGNYPNAYYSVPLGVGLEHIVGYYVGASKNDAYIQTGKIFRDAAPPREQNLLPHGD
jgi:hypothetical protein